ncbi:MAG: LamG domain-containing protein, partial [Phycisphaerae bacterium]|nr:LamG domain-containing protein [Phycisphaerae bacterium]
AVWSDALAAGEVRALYGLADDPVLNYNASQAQALFEAYAAQGSAVVGGIHWAYATGLTATDDGELVADGDGYALVMDATAGDGVKAAYLPPSLRDHWAFDETAGTTAINSAGGTNGTVGTGIDINQPGERGRAYALDGTANGTVTMSGDKGILGTAARSICVWMKSTATGFNTFLANGSNTTGQAWSVYLRDGKGRVAVNGGYRQTTATPLADGNWHHVAFVLPELTAPDVTDTVIFLDGVAQDAYLAGARAVNTVANMDVTVGVDYGGGSYYNGLLDDVAVWAEGLTEGEVRALYNLGNAPDLNYNASQAQALFEAYAAQGSAVAGGIHWAYATGLTATDDGELVADGDGYALVMDATAGDGLKAAYAPPSLRDHWAFDETAGATAINSAGGTNGTIGTGVTLNQPGERGRAYALDGTANGIVTMTGDKGILGTAARSICVWMKSTTAGFNPFISNGSNTTGEAWSVYLRDGRGRVAVNGGFRQTTATPLADGNWHHVAFVLPALTAPDVTDTVIFLDGVAQDAYAAAARAVNTVASMDVTIGGDYNASSYYDGLLDDVAVWADALSAGEVRALYGLAATASLHYNVSQVQTLLEAYAQGPETLLDLDGQKWAYAAGLTTGGDDGELNPLGGGGYELVMDAAAGTGMILYPRGCLIVIR